MKKSKICFLILLFSNYTTFGQTITLPAAINKAGKQRMICERMVKDYMLIGAGVNIKESITDLDDSATMFNENFHDLMIFAKYQDTKIALEQVNILWADFRVRVTRKPEESKSLQILSDGLNLAKACNLVSEKIQPFGGTTRFEKLPNICSKQRMNLQRIGKLFAVQNWGISDYDLDKKIKETIDSFEIGIHSLSTTTENTQEINDLLINQICEWEYLKYLIQYNSKNSEFLSIISRTNDMTKQFDKLTSMYEKLVANKKLELERNITIGQN